MAPARRQLRLPTLIDRGRGLLEVILPPGPADSTISTLPEGQRDTVGFWFPVGYGHPGDIFTAQQRKLQAKQRLVQGRRVRSRRCQPVIVSGSEGTAAADTSPSRPHAPPAGRQAAAAGPDSGTEEALADRSVPLPSPSPEAGPGVLPAVSRKSREFPVSNIRPPLPDTSRARAPAPRGIVDSPRGSD
jgi:hypothetical protein